MLARHCGAGSGWMKGHKASLAETTSAAEAARKEGGRRLNGVGRLGRLDLAR
jgi:hypothetical protein